MPLVNKVEKLYYCLQIVVWWPKYSQLKMTGRGSSQFRVPDKGRKKSSWSEISRGYNTHQLVKKRPRTTSCYGSAHCWMLFPCSLFQRRGNGGNRWLTLVTTYQSPNPTLCSGPSLWGQGIPRCLGWERLIRTSNFCWHFWLADFSLLTFFHNFLFP